MRTVPPLSKLPSRAPSTGGTVGSCEKDASTLFSSRGFVPFFFYRSYTWRMLPGTPARCHTFFLKLFGAPLPLFDEMLCYLLLLKSEVLLSSTVKPGSLCTDGLQTFA